jgi:two-component system chemotaxis response regulator CheY
MGMGIEKLPEFAGIRVLIVDDNEYILRLIRMVVTDLGVAHSAIARDAVEAMKVLSGTNEGINLIICDWNMPGITGLEFLRKVRTDYPAMPFIMLTARSDEGSVVLAKEVGVSAYLVKPFSPLQLEKKLKYLFTPGDQGADSTDGLKL